MPVAKQTIDRLATYSDAILAVVATLLVLGIAVPEDHRFSDEGLIAFLVKMRHDLGAYALSFLIITGYWMQYHVIFLFMHHANRMFTWLNFVFLFFVTLIPFAAKLLAVYRHEHHVVLIYGLLQVLCGLCLASLWLFANWQHRLMVASLDEGVIRNMTGRILLGASINLAAVGVERAGGVGDVRERAAVEFVAAPRRPATARNCQPVTARARSLSGRRPVFFEKIGRRRRLIEGATR